MTKLTQRFAIIVLVLGWAHASAAQTADEIIEKSIAAMGGRAAHDKIKTRVMTGELSIGTPAGDIAGTVEMYGAVPNKQRSVIKADLTQFGAGQLLIDQRFDGTTAYAMDSMQGNREITGSQLENMKAQSFPNPFLNYKASGMSVTLGAKEKVGDRDAYLLTFEPTTGAPIKTYVDAETFMPVRTIVTAEVPQMGKIEQMVDPSDFRPVDGVMVPFKLRLVNSMQSITMTFSKVENNVTLDDKMFVKP
jgi:outer membrane lipoprotein-sorting protein